MAADSVHVPTVPLHFGGLLHALPTGVFVGLLLDVAYLAVPCVLGYAFLFVYRLRRGPGR